MDYGLPKSVEIDGEEFAIRYDYRVILDIFEAMMCSKFFTLILTI